MTIRQSCDWRCEEQECGAFEKDGGIMSEPMVDWLTMGGYALLFAAFGSFAAWSLWKYFKK
jgi:hypothetical protein